MLERVDSKTIEGGNGGGQEADGCGRRWCVMAVGGELGLGLGARSWGQEFDSSCYYKILGASLLGWMRRKVSIFWATTSFGRMAKGKGGSKVHGEKIRQAVSHYYVRKHEIFHPANKNNIVHSRVKSMCTASCHHTALPWTCMSENGHKNSEVSWAGKGREEQKKSTEQVSAIRWASWGKMPPRHGLANNDLVL